MLERKRILKVKEQIVRDGQRVFIYEQPKTGDVFTIADPDLRLDQLEAVQRDVAQLLEHGLNPPAPAKRNRQRRSPEHEISTSLKSKLAAVNAAGSSRRRKLNFPCPCPTSPNFKTVSAANSATKICCASRSRIRPSRTRAARRRAHNQRLEFLGDAVLQLVLTRELYEKFPAFDEGPLTKARAKLVNRRTLAEHARALGLGAHLILSRGEETHGGRERPSALADAFEALLGAIFLDGGFDAAREFILREFSAGVRQVERAADALKIRRANCRNCCRRARRDAPEYQVVSATGPDHDRVFECTVQHGGVELARGSGKSKKAAESDAALAALKKLRVQYRGTLRSISSDHAVMPPLTLLTYLNPCWRRKSSAFSERTPALQCR